ncbi:MAG: major capsid protein [Faecousia sp.]
MNFFDTYVMQALIDEIVPQATFFKDRYFPTEAGDIFDADKVLVEYRKHGRKMAAFVSPRVGDIPLEREGYSVTEFAPAMIAPSRPLSIDDLRKRGFGEALFPGLTPSKRAALIQQQDLADLCDTITRREEWLAVQTMINNECTMQEYIDAQTAGETRYIKFFEDTSDHTYTVQNLWNAENGDFFGDVEAMARALSKRGIRAADLVLGSEVAQAIQSLEVVQKRLDKSSGIITGQIDAELSKYPGVSFLGILNFGGFRLNLICVDESYEDESGNDTAYFPATSAMVTAPGCGHMMYGRITQIDYGTTEYTDHTGIRIPKFTLDQPNDIRKLRVAARPIAVPKNYCPYIYAANVVG